MKINFIINSLGGGGAERVLTTLANGFSESKDVTIITFNEGNNYKLSSSVELIKLHKGSIKNHTLRSIVNLIKYYIKVEHRPDVIISFLPSNALIAIIVARIFGIKCIVSEHSNHLANQTRKKRFIRSFLYPFSSALTVLTSFDLSYFKSKNKLVRIMPNPIILPKNIKPFNQRKRNIIAIGSLNRYKDKGFDRLIKIYKKILNNHDNWTLSIIGEGEDGISHLKTMTKNLGIADRVHFPGFCSNIYELIQDSQIFVLTSKFEGLPMALMEALSNGTACIAYDCVSGPSELIKHNYNGLLVTNQDEKEFVEKLNLLIADDILRNRLAHNASNSMQPFTLSNILKKWSDLFKEIMINK